MKNLNTILLVFTGVLYLSAYEAKCRGKNAAKLKRSLKLAISSDDINNRHKAGLRKIFRRKRDTKDEEVTEKHQRGFLKGRSTVTQMLCFLRKIGEALDKASQTDIIYLDLSKAFDSVSHSRLLFKLHSAGIKGCLFAWLSDYLANRTQWVLVKGCTSKPLPVTSGVPQGSILGPLLLIWYINDLPDAVSNYTLVYLFANGAKLARIVNSPSDVREIQYDITKVSSWTHHWSLKFNFEKCESLSVTRKRQPVNSVYIINGKPISKTIPQKDLGDKFTAEIKFLQKWNPAMSKTDGSAYRLFQGNVLDAVLEQMNADRRFINSRVLDLKKTSDGILAKVGFHFRKGEHNPISHVRFVVSQGHLSSLKVDKHYFKILKTTAKFSNEDDKGKTSTQQQLMKPHNPSVPKQEPNQNSAAQQAHSESPSATISGQIQAQPEKQLPNTYQTQTQPSTGYPNQPQNEAAPQASTQASTQNKGTSGQNQEQSTIANAQAQQSERPQDQNTAQVTTQQQTQAPDQAQNQKSVQGQDNAQVSENQYPTNQPQTQYQTEAAAQQQTNTQKGDAYQTAAQTNAQLTQNTLNPSTNVKGDQTQPNPKPAENAPPVQVPSEQENEKNKESTSLEQNGDAYQTAAQSNAQLTQTATNPSTNVNSDQTQPNPKPAENAPPAQVPSEQENQKNKESASLTKNDDEENVAIKMNQAWFPFLSNHDSPQYKMLAGNLEKGLKSVTEDDKNIKDIKVKDLLQADEGHTTVEFRLKFNGAKEGSTQKLRKIVKTGDIAGISVDASFFKIEDNKKIGA
ncbi:Hypothetical predicted protein [Paramuricea clavata]|uniref:Uncharacterized protein n=1 Tax=Paramuricea clavata TaxID=317549 RepID=A0A6S7JDB2_PARCT|nr:Hypothetical predicted protein [Paramuricea clavata]